MELNKIYQSAENQCILFTIFPKTKITPCMKYRLTFAFIFVLILTSFGQQTNQPVPNNWFLLDPETDSIQGVSAERTYNTLLKGRPSRTVIVAVIDSGIDYEHEDLKDVMWINTREIPGNGIDDDKNGYVDDVYGWNFIGGKEGNIEHETLEITREYARLKKKYDGLSAETVSKKQKVEFEEWETIKKTFEEEKSKADQQYAFYNQLYENISFAIDTLKRVLEVEKLTYDLVSKLETEHEKIKKAKESLSMIYTNVGKEADVEQILPQIKDGVNHFEKQAQYNYNPDYDPRSIVGDDPTNVTEKYYGNNDAKGPDSFHGTHVAGIIAANRKNEIGINGIADNVKIMSVRAVPDGDERDKDVANAIYYAVDNGAHIINMSFGKALSPQKAIVDKAVKYAESKGVLLIHAAGNDGKSNDTDPSFPNSSFENGKQAKNWLEIGASSWGAGDRLVGSFSNYGKKSVSLFAPGVRIYSTTPSNEYGIAQGTSMASPATAGVAAILMSYFPELTAVEVKDILLQSTRKFDGLQVKKPGSKDSIYFNELSSSGGVVNAYEAVKLALATKPGLKNK